MSTLATQNRPKTGVRAGGGPRRAEVLIKFRHGLGDAVQLTVVLRHLARLRRDWIVDAAALAGKHSALQGLCRRVFIMDQEEPRGRYERVFDLSWDECPSCYAQWPSTKAERCLIDQFQITPRLELCRYKIRPRPEDFERARRYLEGPCKLTPGADGRYRAVLIHYEGNTSGREKNLPVETARRICRDAAECGATPIILDWDRRTPLADGRRIFNPDADSPLWGGLGTGDAASIAALVELCALVVAVDSGPLHVAAATKTPTLGVWTGHHPLHYIAPSGRVLHLVPEDHRRLLRGDRSAGEAFFRKHYRSRTYRHLEDALSAQVRRHLGGVEEGLVWMGRFWVRGDNAEQDLVVARDVAEEDCYEVGRIALSAPVVVDVGAHIGCFARCVLDRCPAARVVAVECCPENIPALRKNLRREATIIQAALTYDTDVALLNAVYPNCATTGGGRVVGRASLQERIDAGQVSTDPRSPGGAGYWADLRPLRAMTLEELASQCELERIDLLKLDCEGGELSILRNTKMLDRIGLIVGEYHGKERFLELVNERLGRWRLEILRDGDPGLFRLRPPERVASGEGPSKAEAPRRARRRARPRESDAPPPAQEAPAAPPMLAAAKRDEPDYAFDLLLIDGATIRRAHEHPGAKLRGFARLRGRLWTIDSEGAVYRILIGRGSLRLQEEARSTLACEAHDLTVIDRRLATASPRHNAIALWDPESGLWSLKRPWIPLGRTAPEAEPPRQWNMHHVNSVACDGLSYVLSIFSREPKPQELRWREARLDRGLIIRWSADGFEDRPVAEGLYAPHSLRVHGGRLWWCDAFRARVCRDDGWSSPHLGGFARGLRVLGDTCLVGLSKSRVAPNPHLDVCGVCVLDPRRPESRRVIPLPAPYIEIYDLAPLSRKEAEALHAASRPLRETPP